MFVLQHAWFSFTDNEDWTVLESIMDLMITDLLILAKKERAPDHFTVVSTLTFSWVWYLCELPWKDICYLHVVRLYSLFFRSSRTLLMEERQTSLKGCWDTISGTFASPTGHLHPPEWGTQTWSDQQHIVFNRWVWPIRVVLHWQNWRWSLPMIMSPLAMQHWHTLTMTVSVLHSAQKTTSVYNCVSIKNTVAYHK